MQLSDRNKRLGAAAAIATAIAIPAEGLRQWAYYDPPGILTTCYGHTGTDVVKGKKYSLDECKGLLTDDMLEAITAVENCAPGLPVPVLAAFGDAAFNLGPKIACNPNASYAARYLQAGQLEKACRELPKWANARVGGALVQLPGLVKRRNAEMVLCLQGVQP